MPQQVSFIPDHSETFFDKLYLLTKYYELDSALHESDFAIRSLGIGPNDMERLCSCTVMFGSTLELPGQLLDATSGGPGYNSFGFTIAFPNVRLTSLAVMGITLNTPKEVEFGFNATAEVRVRVFADRGSDVPLEGEVVRVLIGTD